MSDDDLERPPTFEYEGPGGLPMKGHVITGILPCNQDGCDAPAAYRFTWPGREEAGICEDHSVLVTGVASSLGFAVELRPIEGRARPDNSQRIVGHYANRFVWSYEQLAEEKNPLLRYLQAHADALTASTSSTDERRPLHGPMGAAPDPDAAHHHSRRPAARRAARRVHAIRLARPSAR